MKYNKRNSLCVKDGAFILCLIKSSFFTVKQYRIIAYGAFLQSRRFVIRRFVVSTFCSCRRFDIQHFFFDLLSFDVLYVHPENTYTSVLQLDKSFKSNEKFSKKQSSCSFGVKLGLGVGGL
jgi:hypothetical protein